MKFKINKNTCLPSGEVLSVGSMKKQISKASGEKKEKLISFYGFRIQKAKELEESN